MRTNSCVLIIFSLLFVTSTTFCPPKKVSKDEPVVTAEVDIRANVDALVAKLDAKAPCAEADFCSIHRGLMSIYNAIDAEPSSEEKVFLKGGSFSDVAFVLGFYVGINPRDGDLLRIAADVYSNLLLADCGQSPLTMYVVGVIEGCIWHVVAYKNSLPLGLDSIEVINVCEQYLAGYEVTAAVTVLDERPAGVVDQRREYQRNLKERCEAILRKDESKKDESKRGWGIINLEPLAFVAGALACHNTNQLKTGEKPIFVKDLEKRNQNLVKAVGLQNPLGFLSTVKKDCDAVGAELVVSVQSDARNFSLSPGTRVAFNSPTRREEERRRLKKELDARKNRALAAAPTVVDSAGTDDVVDPSIAYEEDLLKEAAERKQAEEKKAAARAEKLRHAEERKQEAKRKEDARLAAEELARQQQALLKAQQKAAKMALQEKAREAHELARKKEAEEAAAKRAEEKKARDKEKKARQKQAKREREEASRLAAEQKALEDARLASEAAAREEAARLEAEQKEREAAVLREQARLAVIAREQAEAAQRAKEAVIKRRDEAIARVKQELRQVVSGDLPADVLHYRNGFNLGVAACCAGEKAEIFMAIQQGIIADNKDRLSIPACKRLVCIASGKIAGFEAAQEKLRTLL